MSIAFTFNFSLVESHFLFEPTLLCSCPLLAVPQSQAASAFEILWIQFKISGFLEKWLFWDLLHNEEVLLGSAPQ
jgi:hypothetical protein